MKKLIVIIIFAMGATLALGGGNETQKYQNLMAKTGGQMRALRSSFQANNRRGTIKAASELEKIFRQSGKFWAGRKTDDAVKWSKDAQDAAREIVAFEKKGEDDKAAIALKTLSNSCTACHDAHREKISGCSRVLK